MTDRRCPAPDCRQRFQTERGMLRHQARAHPDDGRFEAASALVADGGEQNITPRERAELRALERFIGGGESP